MKIQWAEVSMHEVVAHWVKDYTKPVVDSVWFYDATKQKLVLKLYVEEARHVEG